MSKINLGDKAGVVVVATALDMAAESKQGLKHYKNLDGWRNKKKTIISLLKEMSVLNNQG